jgi:hypothetical protein
MELLDSDFLFCLCNFAAALAIVLSVWKIGFCICNDDGQIIALDKEELRG